MRGQGRLRLFRIIRMRLAVQNKTLAYLRYAIGEILLLVIGILIALQVNNWNEQRKQRDKELHYLANIRSDLNMNVAEIDRYIGVRSSQVASARAVLEYFNGKPLEDLDSFNRDAVNVYTWQKFFQVDNTFQELTSSGNIAIISNDGIKNGLLDLDNLYKKLKYEEEHFRYDSEVMLYEPAFGIVDIESVIKNFTYQLTDGQDGEQGTLSRAHFEALLKNVKHKNGFAMATYELPFMNGQLAEMKALCLNIISLIDQELNESQ